MFVVKNHKSNNMSKYDLMVRKIPKIGNGWKNYIYAVSCQGASEGVSSDDVIKHIQLITNQNGDYVPLREIHSAVNKGFIKIKNKGIRTSTQDHKYENREWRNHDMYFLYKSISGIKVNTIVPQEGIESTKLFLNSILEPRELTIVGSRYVNHGLVNSNEVLHKEIIPEFICSNPLSGHRERTVEGGWSYRCDNSVSDRRYVLWECDKDKEGKFIPVQIQYDFIINSLLPWVTIVFSGGKSIHALIKIDKKNPKHCEKAFINELFSRLGADPSCINASRLTRLAGAQRLDYGHSQSLYGARNYKEVDDSWQPFLDLMRKQVK
jgi:hypothetical protein